MEHRHTAMTQICYYIVQPSALKCCPVCKLSHFCKFILEMNKFDKAFSYTHCDITFMHIVVTENTMKVN